MLNRQTFLNHAKQLAETAYDQAKQLPEATTPNYKIAATASATMALIGLVSHLENGNVTTYLAIASALLSAGMAANQYGIENTKQLLGNHFAGLFSKTSINQNSATTQTEDLEPVRPKNM